MTGIQWTDEVWNPTTGCDRVSPGCDHCYAMKMAKRLKGMGQAKYQRDGDPRTSGPGFRLTVHTDAVNVPLRWRKPRKVFVNSMSDLFHADVPAPWLADIFAVMATARRHTFQVLTKRHARMKSLLNDAEFLDQVRGRAIAKGLKSTDWQWPLPNVWLGVSAEDQRWADIRIPALLRTPAVVRFVSAEPLLGPLSLHRYMPGWGHPTPTYLAAHPSEMAKHSSKPALDWVIAGGESGPSARPCDLTWLIELREQCDAEVPIFVKQLGSVLGRQMGAGSKGGDWSTWPADLRAREFPQAAEAVTA